MNFSVKDDLFSFMVGTDDFWLGLGGVQLTDENIDKIIGSIVDSIEILVFFGAKHFLVSSPFNLAVTPRISPLGKPYLMY